MYSINDINEPQILAIEKDFVIVYKPPRMHSAPLANSQGETILHWCLKDFPEIARLAGRKAGEGGLLHRLDYETQGLMLLARTQTGMEALLEQQREGKILKEYDAIAARNKTVVPGFPLEKPIPKDSTQRHEEHRGRKEGNELGNIQPGLLIQSAFRPYGAGRKAVRPVLIDNADAGNCGEIYTTEILECNPETVEGFLSFRLRIWKGFRHQIRAHLAWLGCPILNDGLYGGASYGNGLLALRACSLSFADPSSGEERVYSIPSYSLPYLRGEVK